jgi:hypothetical protein
LYVHFDGADDGRANDVEPMVRASKHSELDLAALARLDLVDPILETETDRPDRIGIGAQPEFFPFHDDVQPAPVVVQAQLDAADVVGQAGVEPHRPVAGLDAGVAALDQVDRPGHGSEMNALRRRAPCTSATSLSKASLNSCQDRSRSERARTQECTTRLSVEPCEVRCM